VQKYIIDGNNLIGKIKGLQRLQNIDKQKAREKLAFLIDNFFHSRNVRVSLHFDGFQNSPIKLTSADIIYSNAKTADERIKAEISASKNPKNITLITSDNNLKEFGRVCSVRVISSEEFEAGIKKKNETDEEELRIRSIDNPEEFKRIFKVKK
jgi:predicted RNA-binding protein with PIN domain